MSLKKLTKERTRSFVSTVVVVVVLHIQVRHIFIQVYNVNHDKIMVENPRQLRCVYIYICIIFVLRLKFSFCFPSSLRNILYIYLIYTVRKSTKINNNATKKKLPYRYYDTSFRIACALVSAGPLFPIEKTLPLPRKRHGPATGAVCTHAGTTRPVKRRTAKKTKKEKKRQRQPSNLSIRSGHSLLRWRCDEYVYILLTLWRRLRVGG